MKRTPIALAVAALPVMLAPSLGLAQEKRLPEVVVTATPMTSPLVIEEDLKTPRQPLPAHDGADYLKTIPGFNVIRKGGTDGDPILRGMAGSRLNILVDGQNVLGGCNFRMDAPTAYIFPEAFDKLTVIKGPQTVLYGAGNSAGTVRFDRVPTDFSHHPYQVEASVMGGSFGRHDEVVDARLGNALVYGQVSATNSQAGDYKDGDGKSVHSAYHRYSLNAALGITPDKDTRIELFGTYSDGWAAYADRGMDGTKFLRESGGLRFEKKNVSSLVEKIEAQISQSDVDHIMDDQKKRTPGTMGYANLKRSTQDFRISTTLALADWAKLTVGVDGQGNEHSSRSATANGVYSAFANDAKFQQYGVFTEANLRVDDSRRVVAGWRADDWKVTDQRASMIMNTNAMGMIANPSSGRSRNETLNSGFARYEQKLGGNTTTGFVGFGHTERFPDYWELIAKQSVSTGSAFDTRAEKTNQLDAGVIYDSGNTHLSFSGFYSQIDDFILVDYRTKAGSGASRNIDARTWGFEAGWNQTLNKHWKLNTTLAYVHGDNRTDHLPLAQLPPLEGRVGVNYDDRTWSFGALLRLVAAQDRYATGQGNIVGKDLGKSAGFGIFSVNAGYRPNKRSLITAGVDNLFDKTYAEFVSRASGNGMGGAIPGYVQTLRVNEPGRTFWLKANISFD